MMGKKAVDTFNETREKLNKKVLDFSGIPIKRFFSLDTQTYRKGALNLKTKELLGLVASMVLRCDDCIKYHLGRCFEEKVTNGELDDAFNVALIVGGSIVIPHLRRAVEYWEDLCNYQQDKETESIIDSLIEQFEKSIQNTIHEQKIAAFDFIDGKSTGIYREISKNIVSNLQLICDTLIDKIKKYSSVLFYIIPNSNDKTPVLIMDKNYRKDENKKADDHNLISLVMKGKKTICLDDCTKEHSFHGKNNSNNKNTSDGKNNRKKAGIKSKIAIPMLMNHTAVGVFIVESGKENAFASSDMESLEKLIHSLMEFLW